MKVDEDVRMRQIGDIFMQSPVNRGAGFWKGLTMIAEVWMRWTMSTDTQYFDAKYLFHKWTTQAPCGYRTMMLVNPYNKTRTRKASSRISRARPRAGVRRLAKTRARCWRSCVSRRQLGSMHSSRDRTVCHGAATGRPNGDLGAGK